jgi:hypothetical protein
VLPCGLTLCAMHYALCDFIIAGSNDGHA